MPYVRRALSASMPRVMKLWYWLIQSLMWPFWVGGLRLFYRIEIRGRKYISGLEPPLLIVSNHKKWFDGFLIGAALPWGSGLFPLRFMIAEFHFHGRVLEFLRKLRLVKLFALLTGGFPSGKGSGVERAVQFPSELLRKGECILIFPEGKVVTEEGLGRFYNGASAIALASECNILPLLIQIKGRTIFLFIGKVFKLNSPTVEGGTSLLRQKISNLYT